MERCQQLCLLFQGCMRSRDCFLCAAGGWGAVGSVVAVWAIELAMAGKTPDLSGNSCSLGWPSCRIGGVAAVRRQEARPLAPSRFYVETHTIAAWSVSSCAWCFTLPAVTARTVCTVCRCRCSPHPRSARQGGGGGQDCPPPPAVTFRACWGSFGNFWR